MGYPKVYLALDNCFAIKRWVQPETWMPLIRELGFRYVEASFDNEADFLYSPDWYLDNWFRRVETLEKEYGMRVANFFTGYQTYRTTGLAHPDSRIATHLLEQWLTPAIRRIGALGSGIGFSFHAMPDEVLQNPELYRKVTDQVIGRLARVAALAKENGEIPACVEAMYAPHQPPWTIEGTKRFLKDIYAVNGDPIYTTVDVGHMTGQARFQKPDLRQVLESLENAEPGRRYPHYWIGSEHTARLWREAAFSGTPTLADARRVCEDMERFPYLYSDSMRDADPYAWLEELGCYSPIIHMQQTNGVTASHAAFTDENNREGIIHGERLLYAIAKSYEAPDIPGMPPKAKELYLSFEIFAANAEYRSDILQKLEETCRYWRRFVPEDGTPLDQLLKKPKTI